MREALEKKLEKERMDIQEVSFLLQGIITFCLTMKERLRTMSHAVPVIEASIMRQ